MGNYYSGVMNSDYDSELKHFGILGQKWGIRRYQNEDGTLTNLGKERYYHMRTKLEKIDNSIYKKTKKAARAENKLRRAAASVLSPLYSDEEVAKRNTRALKSNLGLKRATISYKKLERRFNKEFGHITKEQADEIMLNQKGFREKAMEFLDKFTNNK